MPTCVNDKIHSSTIRHLFPVVLAVAVGFLSYFLFFSNFLLDGHFPRMPNLPIGPDTRGNFIVPYLNRLFYGANLPVLPPFVAVLAICLSGWLMTVRFELQSSRIVVFLACCFIIAFPFQITVFYYSFATHTFALSQLIAVSSVLLVFSEWKYRDVPTAALVFIAMATYQPSVSIVFTLWAVFSALIVLEESSAKKRIAARILRAASVLAVGALAYFLTVKLFVEHQVVESRSLADILSNANTVARASFLHLWLTQPEFIRPIKFLLLLPVIGAFLVVLSLRAVPMPRRLSAVLFLIGAVVLTKTLFFISTSEKYYIYRYNYALGFLYLGMILVYIKYSMDSAPKWMWKLLVALMFGMIWIFAGANLHRQHILLRAQTMDLALYNRMIARIELLKDFDPETRYYFVVHGGMPNFRTQLFDSARRPYDVAGAEHIDESTPANWNPESAFRYLGSTVKTHRLLGDRRNQLTRAAQLVSEREAEPWPHASSVFIDGDLIVVAMKVPE